MTADLKLIIYRNNNELLVCGKSRSVNDEQIAGFELILNRGSVTDRKNNR